MKQLALWACLCARLFAAPMPLPSKIVPASGALRIDAGFTIETHGCDERMDRAAWRLTGRIGRLTGIPMTGGKAMLIAECSGKGESYQLDISSAGAQIRGSNEGVLHAFETFLQLIEAGRGGFEIAAAHIEDHPRFAWRGLMIDASRHWIPLEVIERNLDAMAAVKLNVFHWHLSDDQGFRAESKRFPRLQQFGSDGHFYTQDQMRHIVEYARDRGIRVIPEFDIPGHTTSWFVGYPELASAPGPYAIERRWGIFQPTMDPTREEVYRFLDGLIGEMAAIFPDPYFHIGGDEVDPTQWKKSDTIQKFAADHHISHLQTYFNQHVQEILKKYGKTMIGWDEILDPAISTDAVIQSWRGQASLEEAARQGYRGILSWGFYLDHLKPAGEHYAVDPLPSGESGKKILGGEACMWSEYVTEETIDSRIWPRMAAIAERLWSDQDVTDVNAMYRRLESIRRFLPHGSSEMLDRIATGQPIRILAAASEALGHDGRSHAREYTSDVPLNRFVDAIAPESGDARLMEQAVARLDYAMLRVRFTEWAENDTRLRKGSFLEQELIPLSRNLSSLGSMGLELLEDLRAGHAPASDWVAEQRRLLDEFERPVAEVRLAAVRPVRALLEAAARSGSANK